jgi:hypothetical protein
MPSLNFDAAPIWLQWLIAAVALIGFIAGCIKGIPPAWHFVTRFVTTVNELAELPTELNELRTFRTDTTLSLTRQDATLAGQNATLAEQNVKIAEIHHEVNYNNGSSVKDAVARVEAGVEGLYGEIDALKQEDASIRRDFKKTEGDTNV